MAFDRTEWFVTFVRGRPHRDHGIEAPLHRDLGRPDRATLVGQRGHADAPPFVERTEQRIGRDHDVGEEHLVELRAAGHLPQRANLDARQRHVEQEERDALVLRSVGVGPGHQDAPVADSTSGAPDLLAVDHEGVTIGDCRGPQRRKIAPGLGLAEELAPHLVGLDDRAEVSLLLLRSPELEQPLACQDEPDHVDECRDFGVGALLDPDRLMLRREAAAAVLGRPVDPRPSGRMQSLLPRHAGVSQVGRHDRAVVVGRVARILGQPRLRIESEVFELHDGRS